MKIQLEYPFNEKWKYGYLVTNSENRKNIILYNNQRDRSTISYARYLMSVKLKRFLNIDEEVDHIDNDKTNDSIDNLQILSKKDNFNKYNDYYKNNIQQKYIILCNECLNVFTITERILSMRFKQSLLGNGSGYIFCSRECSSRYLSKYMKNNSYMCRTLDKDKIIGIKNLRSQGLSCYKIADLLKISRNTVMKYW